MKEEVRENKKNMIEKKTGCMNGMYSYVHGRIAKETRTRNRVSARYIRRRRASSLVAFMYALLHSYFLSYTAIIDNTFREKKVFKNKLL